jgi:hypothetical protein
MFIVFLLFILVTMGISAFTTSLIIYLFCITAFGFATACYSTLQSTILYLNSSPELRSSTFSLLTIAIGSGALGALNILVMSDTNTTPMVGIVIAVEGLVALVSLLLILYVLHPTFKMFKE